MLRPLQFYRPYFWCNASFSEKLASHYRGCSDRLNKPDFSASNVVVSLKAACMPLETSWIGVLVRELVEAAVYCNSVLLPFSLILCVNWDRFHWWCAPGFTQNCFSGVRYFPGFLVCCEHRYLFDLIFIMKSYAPTLLRR